MKKIASAAATVALLGGGLVGATTTAANSAPYPGTINTVAEGHHLNAPRVGHAAKVEFRVKTGGNGAAHGVVHFSYVRRSNHVVVDQFDRRYRGPGYTKYAFRGIPRGRYTVRVFFNSKPVNSVYQNDRERFFQRVRPRR